MKLNKLAALVAITAASGSAFATNGYFSHGYGMKAKGMAGVATASASDAFGGANNPASMVWAGDRLDLGLDWFSPKRSAARSGGAFGAGMLDGTATSGSNNFYVPEFGYNKMLGWDMSVGVTVYGNGGMNTDYPNGQTDTGLCTAGVPSGALTSNMLCGNTRLGVDLMQLVIAPTFAMKINKDHSLGISPLIGYQRFKAEGLQAFDNAGFSASPGNVTNRGYDSAHGFGLRLGWMGKVSDTVTLGAAYSTKIKMSKFGKYQGLFAEQGDFDMPENYNLGVSWKVTPSLTMGLDYQTINYAKVASVGNASNSPGAFGASNGAGFGWSNVSVVKLGAEYQYSGVLTLRAGYSWGKNPIQARDITVNILAPGVIADHATLGFTYKVSKDSELTMAYTHALKHSVSGATSFDRLFAVPAGTFGTERIEMYQNSLGIAYGLKF